MEQVKISAEADIGRWRMAPMRSWPKEAFDELGLRNPYAPGNLTIRRQALEQTRHLGPAAVVECGVYQGQGLATLAWWLREQRDGRMMWGFDSFAGFPSASSQDAIGGTIPHFSRPEYYAATSLEATQAFIDRLGLSDRVRLVPGFFHDTLTRAPIDQISILILDCDLYDSYKVCLTELYPRIVPSGWIIFDEYFSPKYPGARSAVDEFFGDKPEKPELAAHLLDEHPYERWYVVKK